MTKEEYLDKKREIRKEYNEKVYELAKEFVMSNTDIKRGDFVKDHIGTVKVEVIKPSYGLTKNVPQATYYGVMYTKAGKPFKSGEKRAVWGGNLI